MFYLFFYILLSKTDHGFDSLLDDINRINFDNLENLTSLDISCSKSNDKIVEKLFKSSKTLKSINLSYCSKITDNLFIGLSINCPLEELNLSFVQQVCFIL